MRWSAGVPGAMLAHVRGPTMPSGDQSMLKLKLPDRGFRISIESPIHGHTDLCLDGLDRIPGITASQGGGGLQSPSREFSKEPEQIRP